MITFRIDGIQQIIAGLNNMITDSQNAKNAALQQAGEFMANEMKNNVHVITGKLKGSISSQVMGDSAIVEAGAEYAIYENARKGGIQGPHDFADRAYYSTLLEGPNIVKRAYDQVFSI